MDFDDSPEEAAFRGQARAWLDANAPKHLEGELRQSTFGMFALKSIDPILASKAWQRKKFDAGWACLHWPRSYGGRDATPIQRVIWQQEEGPYAALSGLFSIGHNMCGPTLMAWANDAQKQARLPALAAGEEIWCQLFSEPAGGSDLAGLRTRAEKDGQAWRINGQKIWTSRAHYSDFGLLLARSDPTVAKHKGLTMFFLDMRTPGVEIRPIKQANGGQTFNEVFFTDVRIPDSQRLGEVGQGWQVSMTTLMNERMSMGAKMSIGFAELFAFCRQLEIGGRPALEDRAVRSRLASFAVRASGLKCTAMRAVSAISQGRNPGPENSIGKLVGATAMQELAMYALDLQGEAGIVDDPALAPLAARFQTMLLRTPATRVEGGTDEILRNIVAERVLGLPADIRVDKNVPFNAIPTRAAVE
jgi:alkylation response protein AidB-like acyl-CoA dehydrogenase